MLGVTWTALRYMVRFNLAQYSSRVHVLNPSSIPAATVVCAPAACTPEMVGRFVFPEFHIDGFDVRNMAGWPILGKEVSVEEDSQDDWKACTAALNVDLPGYAAFERCETRPRGCEYLKCIYPVAGSHSV